MIDLDFGSILALALAGGVAGAIGWSVRAVPQNLFKALRRALTSELEVRTPEVVELVDRLIPRRGLLQIDGAGDNVAPGRGWHFFRHDGRMIVAHRTLDDEGGGSNGALAKLLKRPNVKLHCLGGSAPLLHLVETAREQHRARQRERNRSLFWVQGDRRDWVSAETHQTGGMGSVVLPAGLAEEMVDDVKNFLGGEAWYGTVGRNWCRGYGLFGGPGTGKTRTAYAIAQEFDLRLYRLDVGRPYLDDADVQTLMREIPRRSVVLLDDLDRTIGERSDSTSRVTIAGLLHAFESPGAHGRVIIVTANRPDELDEALRRRGRIDREWHFLGVDEGQARRLFLKFHPGQVSVAGRFAQKQDGRPAASVVEDLLAAGVEGLPAVLSEEAA